jgi:TRAP-type uncharacterized transport system substrate-binding protein
MSTQTKLVRAFWKWVAPLAGLGALGLAVFFFFHSAGQRSYRLRITAGNRLGMRHQVAQMLQGELAHQGIELELHETHGSEEALDQVNARTLDAALVQGGLKSNGRPAVRQVLPLHMEALHLLVKVEWLDKVSQHLGALEGKRVGLSETGSGTHSLAVDVLAFAGLHPRDADHPRGYVPVEMSRQKMLAEKDRARLPDAFLLVSLLPSPTAHYMVDKHRYRLVPLPFAEAFGLEALAPPETGFGRGNAGLVDKGHTYPILIPAFACSVEPPVPAEPVPTIGTRLLLVAHRDVSRHEMRHLVEAVLRSKLAHNGHPPLDAQALDMPPEFPWHDGTKLYRARNEPVVSGMVLDSAQKGLAIFAAAASGLFVLWQWSKQRRHLVLAAGFHAYLQQVTRIEKQAQEIEGARAADPGQLAALQEELRRLKTEALDRFTEGELRDKELLVGFLAQVADVRAYLLQLSQQQRARPAEQADNDNALLLAPRVAPKG